MFGLFKRRRRERLRAAPFPHEWEQILRKNVPLYGRLPEADRRELHGHIQVFLAEKHFEGCGGLDLTDEIKLTIAAQACLLLLHRDTDYYRRLITILVYPDRLHRQGHRADRRGRGPGRRGLPPGRSLEGRGGRPVLGRRAGAGRPTSTTGTTSCCTSSPTSSTRRTGRPTVPRSWTIGVGTWPGHGCWGPSTSSFAGTAERGRRSVLDEYGATNPAEFFAVATECFFEKPAQMKKKHPALYEELKGYYRQDPEQMLSGDRTI